MPVPGLRGPGLSEPSRELDGSERPIEFRFFAGPAAYGAGREAVLNKLRERDISARKVTGDAGDGSLET